MHKFQGAIYDVVQRTLFRFTALVTLLLITSALCITGAQAQSIFESPSEDGPMSPVPGPSSTETLTDTGPSPSTDSGSCDVPVGGGDPEGGGGVVGGECTFAPPVDPGTITVGVEPTTLVTNPIDLITGNKTQAEVDFQIPGAALRFRRIYNSANADYNVGLGNGWHHTYSVSLMTAGSARREIVQSNGSSIWFDESGSDEQGHPLYRSTHANYGYVTFDGEHHNWHLADGRTLRFYGSYLTNISWPDQRRLKLYYKARRLYSVTDETGRVLRFHYTEGSGPSVSLSSYEAERFGSAPGHLSQITLPDGSELHYDYDNNRNLTRVRFDDDTSREYHYEDKVWITHLTGLTDRTGVRFASWTYDDQGRAVSSEHAGGVERVTLQYPDFKATQRGEVVETVITNSLGAQTVYQWQKRQGMARAVLLSSSGAGCSTCPTTGYEYSYDSQGRLLSQSKTGQGNARGSGRITYAYDEQSRLVEIRRTDAAGVEHLVERREFEGTRSQPVRTYKPSVNPDGERVSEIVRDAQGRPVTVIERGYAPWVALPGEPEYVEVSSGARQYRPIERISKLTYNSQGQVESIDGPRIGVEDITSYLWDEQGRLTGIEPAESPTIQLFNFDALGRPTALRIGQQSPFQVTYGTRGEILEVKHRTTRVTFNYDAERRLVSFTDGDGQITQLTNDEAGRLTSVTGPFGRVLKTQYDSESRAYDKSLHGIDGSLVQALTMVFDDNGRITEQSDQRQSANGNITNNRTMLDYDGDGEFAGATDLTSGARIAVELDLLNLTRAWITPSGERTTYLFDTVGQEAGLIDARGNETAHWRDDFGRRTAIISADTGRERLERNAAGDVVARVRQDSGTTSYSRDAAGRLLTRLHSNGVSTRFTYDELTGQLASIATDKVEERFTYNWDGQVLVHVRKIDTHQFETRWKYGVRGRIVEQLLPDGQTLNYYYHDSGPNVGQLRAITRDRLLGFDEQTVVSDIDLEKRDGSTGWLSHNNLRTDIRVAANGEVTAIDTHSVLGLQYEFDDLGKIVGITEDGDKRSFAYDGSRISLAKSKQAEIRYVYDSVGNRLSREEILASGERSVDRYTYANPGSGNRLISTFDSTLGLSEKYGYDSAGSPIKRGEIETVYDNERRSIRVKQDDRLIAEYTYNGFGERVKKVVYNEGVAPTVTYYLYSHNVLIAEANELGVITTQYLYLESFRPVAQLKGDAIHAIHTDHLGSPLRMSDDSAEIIWSASYTPFGQATVSIETQSLPLRLPGQYLDAETGTHYNYFRDYDPSLGRYLSADPIGLTGGINAYGYVGQDPLRSIDPLGLFVLTEYYRALLQAGTIAAADGPLPVGDALAAAFLLTFLIQDLNSMPDLSQADLRENYNAVMAQVRLYEPGFGDAHSGDWNPSEQELRDLTDRLITLQGNYIWDFETLGSCFADFDQDTYENARNAETIRGLIGQGVEDAIALQDQPFNDLDEAAYQDYTANGGRRTRADWEIAGKPANLLVERLSLTKGSARARLDRELGGEVGDGLAAHHIIPLEAIDRFPELMRRAAEGGFDINGADSGLLLGPADHVGGHPVYNSRVLAELGAINISLSPQEIAGAVKEIVERWIHNIRDRVDGPWH